MKQIREGKNGWMCMVAGPDVMCLDKIWQGWADAWVNKKDPEVKAVGIAYMLRGDNGASNTDPYATAKTADNHWITTGSHIMVVGAAAKSMGLPDSPDADPTKPYLMWANTPYAHAMIPIGGGAHAAAPAAKPASDMKDMKDMK